MPLLLPCAVLCSADMWLSSLVLAWLFLTAMGAAPAPVILVPGTAGSQLQARLDKPSVTHFYCSRHSAWYTIWLDVSQLLPEAINCWCDNIRSAGSSFVRQELKAHRHTLGMPLQTVQDFVLLAVLAPFQASLGFDYKAGSWVMGR